MKAAPLGCAEWDFERLLGSLSNGEIEVCYHYEFTREVPALREKIDELRKYRTSLGNSMRFLFGEQWTYETWKQLTHHHSPISPEYFEFFLSYLEWPNTPYLAIDPKKRERYLKALTEDDETSDEALAKRLTAPFGIQIPNICKEIKLVIPIYHTHQRLLEAFGAYLRLNFPAQGKAGKMLGTAEIRTQRNALRALGVYRLRTKMTAPAVLKFLEQKQGKLAYHDESAINRAKGLATKHIASFGKFASWTFSWLGTA